MGGIRGPLVRIDVGLGTQDRLVLDGIDGGAPKAQRGEAQLLGKLDLGLGRGLGKNPT